MAFASNVWGNDTSKLFIDPFRIHMRYWLPIYNASKMCEECQWKEVNNNLLSIALEYKDISIFGFSKYMYDKTEDLKWLELAIEILIKALSHVDGAEQLASFYKRELLRSSN